MPALTTTVTTTTNFDKTVVTRVLANYAQNLRRDLAYAVAGSYIEAELVPGFNLVRHIAYGDLSLPTAAQADGTPPWLFEGTPPAEDALTITYDEFGVNQIGRTVSISDRAMAYNPHNLFQVATERIYWNSVAQIDQIIGGVAQGITATTTNGHAAAALVAPADNLTSDQVRLMRAKLEVNGVPEIGGNYICIAHPYALYDLQGDTKWVNVANYATPENMLTGEVGRLYGVRFIKTTVGTWVNNAGGAGSVPVYSSLFFGADFMAIGDFGSVEVKLVRPGGDHADPLAQKAIVGYKAYVGAKVLTTLGTRAFRLVHSGSVAGAPSI